MKAKQYGPWTIKDSQIVLSTDFLTVRNDTVHKPDGSPGTYTTVQLKSGVAVLPVDDEGQVYLVKQFRYSIGRDSIEVISGGIDGEEPPEQAVRREAEEEAGIVAENWTDLGKTDLDTSIVNCPVYMYLARKLTFRETHREATEKLEIMKVPYPEALRMVNESLITHSPSCVLILKARQWLEK
jgi:8-oxo-dGTP pyrophosphatase MutT (NUDIX family)